MKPVLSSADWGCVFDQLNTATNAVAEMASLLDECLQTDACCDEAKNIEMDLNILESRLRRMWGQSKLLKESA
jgi:hypothetical protein